MYVWSPHFWFHLLDLKKELQAMRAMHRGGNKHFLMIGSDSFVDRLPSGYWNKKVYQWSYAPGPFEKDRRHYFDVIDDYVLTVTFSEDFVARLDKLCFNIHSQRDLSSADLKSFFDAPTPATITLENNNRKANALRGKFIEYFD